MSAYSIETNWVLMLHPDDNVGIAMRDLGAGTRTGGRTIAENIPAGHKVALEPIAAGQSVLRYGQRIGAATRAIAEGGWVHTHNLAAGAMKRDFLMRVAAETRERRGDAPVFQGFPRADGRAGTRNYIAVVSTVSCSAQAARAIAHAFSGGALRDYPQVDGVVALTHNTGCCAPPDSTSFAYLRRTLENAARHPNVGAAIYVSLGCEGNQMEAVVPPTWRGGEGPGLIGPFLTIQRLGGVGPAVEAGVAAIRELLPRVNDVRRQPVPLSALIVAVQCGGSDGWSGVTANPLVGRVADRLVDAGGTVVLAETPEIYGAEHLLLNRVASRAVGDRLVEKIREWERQAALQGFSLDNNPSPGNKAGGLTTIYEKSLGAVAKGGSRALRAVYDYAEWVDARGLVFMDTPGYDPVAVTGQIAGGCNLVVFTTGRGSVFGGLLAPCVKVASNSELYRRMNGDMDYNAGALLDGRGMDEAAGELERLVIETASGRRSKSEGVAFRDMDFVPWQLGPTL